MVVLSRNIHRHSKAIAGMDSGIELKLLHICILLFADQLNLSRIEVVIATRDGSSRYLILPLKHLIFLPLSICREKQLAFTHHEIFETIGPTGLKQSCFFLVDKMAMRFIRKSTPKNGGVINSRFELLHLKT
ncbi:hypothetical protein TNCV_4656621 [Trichonephila clavipes]|nr:hypothetical protein TNCV_4656621 [Trichonephila clavipes]